MSEAESRFNPDFARLLSTVRGPGQYVGGEPNQVVKPEAAFRMAFAFADVYAVGMSYHGMRILYDIGNGLDGIAVERVFAPFPDMEEALRADGRRLSTLETGTPLNQCQAVGFSLGYELAATSVLTILDLGGIPLTRFERARTGGPLVMAGGGAVINPEPFSDFVDLFMIGEGEEAFPEILELAAGFQPFTPERRAAFLRAAARIEGVYVPELYDTAELADGTVVVAGPRGDAEGVPFPVRRRTVDDFDAAHQPTRPVVPIHEAVHERAVLEIMRGCPNGCRFCQAGFVNRPLRERSPEKLFAAAKESVAATGYDEIGLLSLSTSNYSRFDELVQHLDEEFAPCGVSLSLPSLRVDHALSGIPSRFKSVRKSGLTVAPEAGSDRLRAVINKDVKNSDLLAAAEEAFRQNWRQIKLYFMVGLPTETEEDVLAIAELAHQAARMRRHGPKGRPAIHLSVSNFVPKPGTPFQWFGAAGVETWTRRQALLGAKVNRRLAVYKGHDAETSILEAAFSRGDRRLGEVILNAWRLGARLDAWTEHFRPDLWRRAFAECGIDLDRYAERDIDPEAQLAWDHVDCGVRKDFLKRELARALAVDPTLACGKGACAGCGVSGCGFIGGGDPPSS